MIQAKQSRHESELATSVGRDPPASDSILPPKARSIAFLEMPGVLAASKIPYTFQDVRPVYHVRSRVHCRFCLFTSYLTSQIHHPPQAFSIVPPALASISIFSCIPQTSIMTFGVSSLNPATPSDFNFFKASCIARNALPTQTNEKIIIL